MKLRMMLLAAACLASPGGAAWHQATSPHFVIYADEDPAKLKAYAEKLERFDQAVRLARGMKDPALAPGNRLRVFIVPDTTAVTKLHPGRDSRVAGFYRLSAINGVAVVPRDKPKNLASSPDSVFFHEYAHHLMFQQFTTPMPAWLVEGFAEFYGMTDVNADGSVGFGAAPVHRARTLRQPTNPLPFSQMLAGNRASTSQEMAALYARGWLLTHYLTFSKERGGQLDRYLAGMAAGRDPVAAATEAFGPLGQLEVDTDLYLRADKFPYLTLPADRVNIGPVNVTALGAAGEAIMPLKTRLNAGGDEDYAKLAESIRAVSARFPNDLLVLETLAEAENRAKQHAAARQAADRALAIDANSVNALIVKGWATMEEARGKGDAAPFVEARALFNRANRIEPENPVPLILYFNSFGVQGIAPTANAIAAVRYASELAPQDMGLRIIAGKTYLAEGKKAEARRALIPVAYYPHGGRLADEARALIEKTK